MLDKNEAQDRGGKKANEDIANEVPRDGTGFEETFEDRPERPPIKNATIAKGSLPS